MLHRHTLALRYSYITYSYDLRYSVEDYQVITVRVNTKSLLQEITVFLLVRQVAVAVDVGQPGQPLVQLG